MGFEANFWEGEKIIFSLVVWDSFLCFVAGEGCFLVAFGSIARSTLCGKMC